MSVPDTLSSQASATKALSSQVGGHPGVLTTEDGSLLIKPAHATEVAFYQTALTDPAFAPLRPFVPKFLGTLKLEGTVKPDTEGALTDLAVKAASSTHKDSLVLENLSFPFLKPNILDVKLGTVLYDEDASPEKKERMDKAARDTTTHETGVRLTGFQVYDSKTGTAVATPKAYGKSIKAKDLPDGMARFFPLAEGDSTLGLPRNLLLPIVRGVRKNVAEIRDALAGVELRMVGGSILVIYEGDPTRAEETLKALKEDKMDGEEDDDDDDDEEKPKLGPPYLVKLIDFAHAKFTPGQGPDEGVLKGLDTVLGLLDGRIKSIADN